jgi:hypothetical protein
MPTSPLSPRGPTSPGAPGAPSRTTARRSATRVANSANFFSIAASNAAFISTN